MSLMSLCRLTVVEPGEVFMWGGILAESAHWVPVDSLWMDWMPLILRVSRLLKFSRPCFTSNLLMPCRLIPLVNLLISFLVQFLL